MSRDYYMRDTPRTDAYIEMLEGAKADVFSALPALQDWARLLERENANLRASLAERQRDVNALMEDIRKGDDMLMAWFKAASPYATPGSLEEGLRKLRADVIEECARLVDEYNDQSETGDTLTMLAANMRSLGTDQ